MMPPWKTRLTENEICVGAAYAQNLSVTAADLSAGKTVYAENCDTCHGADGVGDGIDLTQPTLLINKSSQDLFDELRAAQGDHASLTTLPDAAIRQSLIVARNFSLNLPALDGTLKGKLLNGSTGEPVANMPITLHVVSSTGDSVQTVKGVSAEDGSFVFENLNRDHTLSYILEADYKNIPYFSPEPAIFLPDKTETDLNLNVYETTDDPAVVSQSTLHRIMAFAPNEISVADVYVLGNSGDKTYIGKVGADGQPETIKVAIPANAVDVQFRSDTVRQTDDGAYVDSRPVVPGEGSYTLFVTYFIPFEGKSVSMELPVYNNIDTINILAADQGEQISSPQLENAGNRTIQGEAYQLWGGQNLAAGQSLVMEFSQLNKLTFPQNTNGQQTSVAATTSLNQTMLIWGVLGLGILVIAGVLIFSARTQPEMAVVQSSLAGEQDRLLVLLSELDRMRQVGELDEPTYQRLKQKNRTLLKQILAQRHD